MRDVGRDPFPTVRRLARPLTWRRCARALALFALLAALGSLSSVLSSASARRQTRARVAASLTAPPAHWPEEAELVRVRLTGHDRELLDHDFHVNWTNGDPLGAQILRDWKQRLRAALFAPTYGYRERNPTVGRLQRHALVRVERGIPFLLRAHFSWTERREETGRSTGRHALGVVTYVGLFGMAIPISTVEGGAVYHGGAARRRGS